MWLRSATCGPVSGSSLNSRIRIIIEDSTQLEWYKAYILQNGSWDIESFLPPRFCPTKKLKAHLFIACVTEHHLLCEGEMLPEAQGRRVWYQQIKNNFIVDLAVAAGDFILILQICSLQAIPLHWLPLLPLIRAYYVQNFPKRHGESTSAFVRYRSMLSRAAFDWAFPIEGQEKDGLTAPANMSFKLRTMSPGSSGVPTIVWVLPEPVAP